MLNLQTNKDMIVKENITREDGVILTKTYSNDNKYIRKVGTDEVYSEAIDVKEYEYEETDIEIEQLNEEL